MENKAHALAAGIFVAVVAALLVGLASWLSRDTGQRDIYEISTRETLTGLQAQAPVRFRGVDVGKVAAIGFDAKALGNVLIRLEVDHDAPITRDTFATLGFQGVTGLSFVQLDDHGKPAPRLVAQDGQPPRIPLEPGLLNKLATRGEAILDQVDQITAKLNTMLGDANQKRFASTLDSLGQAAADASHLAQRLDNTVAHRLDPALAQATDTLRSAQKTSDAIGATAQRLNQKDGPVDRLAEGTASLSHATDAFSTSTLPRINRVTEEATRAVRQLGRTATAVGDNPQSLIFGNGKIEPGPGEPGFAAPQGAR